MKVFRRELTTKEFRDLRDEGDGESIVAVVAIPLNEIIEAEGIDDFNEIVDDFFPDCVLSGMVYSVVGYDEGENDNGSVHIQVIADIQEMI